MTSVIEYNVMTPFEKWWGEHFEGVATDPHETAKAAWDAALVLANEEVLRGTYWDLDRVVT